MPYPSTSLYPKSSGLYPTAKSGGEYSEAPNIPALTLHGAVEKLQPGRYMVRHIAPKASNETESGIYAPLGAGFVVLNQTLYADPLPQLRLPESPDMHEGKYTLRMLDAGDFSLGFPNRDASDGQPWRSRFDANGAREWVEISREGQVEFIGVVNKLRKSRQEVTLEGYDGLFLLKKAFEQEWTGVMAPRDVIERYSGLWVAKSARFNSGGFLGHAPEGWIRVLSGEGHVAYLGESAQNWGASMYIGTKFGGSSEGGAAILVGPTFTEAEGASWSVRADFGAIGHLRDAVGREARMWAINGAGTDGYVLVLRCEAVGSLTLVIEQLVASATAYKASIEFGPNSPSGISMNLVCDGRWVAGYANGQLVGYVPTGVTGSLTPRIDMVAPAFASGAEPFITLHEVVGRAVKPFLMRGSEKGEYVLPGTAQTYPNGGLHGRWISYPGGSSTDWYKTVLAPDPRRPNYPSFTETQDATINNPTPPGGISTEAYAVRWFGSVYLDLENNASIEFQISNLDDGARLWVGKTRWGDQIIDDWNVGGARTKTATVTAAALGAKKGWFPIILEYFEGFGAPAGIVLSIKAAKGWKEPVGFEEGIKAATLTVIPASYLSPLGCVDARVQGSSFFDTVIETAKNFGYQIRCEPRQLESGEFPGRIVPQARVGKATDEIIEAGDIDRRSEVNNYTLTEDATDSATSLRAFGSGIADGKGSQIAFEALSGPDAAAALFDLQAWVQAGDIAFAQLLRARAEAELALRLGAWENIEGEPIARDRLADTFPLTGVLSQFHWQPGDGVRLRLPDVNLEDTTPRAIMQVTRSFSPEGRTGTQIGFRARPKDPIVAIRNAIREATRPPRAWQHQYVTRPGQYIAAATVAPSTWSEYSRTPLVQAETVVDARLHIVFNTANQPLEVEINGVNRTAALGGPWTSPFEIDVHRFAGPAANDQRMYVRVANVGASNTVVEFQLILHLLV